MLGWQTYFDITEQSRPWSMATEPQSWIGFCIDGKVFCKSRVAKAAY